MNKIQTRIVSLLVAITITIGLLPGLKVNAAVVDSGTCGPNLTWTLDDAGTLTISGSGAIATSAFSDSNNAQVKAQVKTVVIEEGITGIGSEAFRGWPKLVKVTVPVSVKSIGDYAFADCTALTSFEADAALLQQINESVFSGCNPESLTKTAYSFKITYNQCDNGVIEGRTGCPSLDTVVLNVSPEPGYVVDTVTFTDNKGTTTTITPDSDGKYSFTMPSGEVTVDAAFKQLGANANIVDSGNCGAQGDNVSWTLDDAGVLTISGTGAMADYDFSHQTPWYSDMSNVTSIVISDGVTAIGDSAFWGCNNASSVQIGSTVETIGKGSFRGCTSINSITLPESVQSIGSAAFFGCTGLESINIPAGVSKIEGSTFDSCSNLKSITIPDSVTTIDIYAFKECTSLESVEIPASVTSYDIYAFYGCTNLKNVTIADGSTIVGGYEFYGCTSLNSITIPNSVTSIGNGAFYNCTSLADVTMSKTLYDILVQNNKLGVVFSGIKLPSIHVRYTVDYKSNGNGTITGTTTTSVSGESIVLTVSPSSGYVVKEVTYTDINNTPVPITPDASGNYSFTMPSCNTTVSATFIKGGICGANGDNVTWTLDDAGTLTISGTGDMADFGKAPWYDDIRSIVSVNIADGVASIGDFAFDSCTNLTSITIPSGVTSIGYCAFQDCSSLTSITIPNSVTSIGAWAFCDCINLTSITIPNSVTSIDSSVFYNCYKLTDVTIPSSVDSIGNNVFLNCNSLKSITVDYDLYEKYPGAFTGLSADKFNFRYEITFKDENGTVLQSSKVLEGETPTYTGATPTKPATAQYTYSFSGWTPTIIPVEGDATYTATYDNTVNKYTVTFVDADGNQLQSGEVAYGQTPVYSGTTPTKAEDDKYTYTFSGWTPAIVSVTGNATYTATFTATAKPTPAPTTPAPTPSAPTTPAPTPEPMETPVLTTGIAHVQDIGDVSYTTEAGILTIGTRGMGKRLEEITINFENTTGLSGTLEYRVHVQDYGWMEWVPAGTKCGTEGEAKRIEAIEIRFTGELAEYYSVEYCVHIQDYGDMQGWVKDGALAGTTGESKRIEELKIRIVPKHSGSSMSVKYRVHVQDYGWEGAYASNGQMSGTSGESKRLEGIEIFLDGNQYSGGVKFKTHVQDYGWQGWSYDGEMSGTQGESKRLEGICIELYGEIANYYDIYYRVHAQDIGWMAWAKNGECAGTAGRSARLEGIQIVLVPKGDPAPGATYEGITAVTDKAFIEGF